MEVYILDTLLRRIDVVDTFISMIWTERFAEMGDFELVTLSNSANRKRFVSDTMIMINSSNRIMRIETIEETSDLEKGVTIKIKGRELLSILDSRVAVSLNAFTDLIDPVWSFINHPPAEIMREIFYSICVAGDISADDIIPYIETEETLYPTDTIPEPTDMMDWAQKPASVYSALRDLAETYDLGFRLYKDPNVTKLYFNVYAGSDRTSAQTALPAVIFSADMENLQNTTEYTDNSNQFNVVQVIYVYKDVDDTDITASVIVSDPDLLLSTNSFDRKAKVHMVTAIPEDVVDIETFLIQTGKEELLKSRPIGAFDGEVDKTTKYVYETDYYLGDLVEIRGNNGSTGYMRVTEQIRIEDAAGERSYPTLVTKTFINPGTWASWKYDIEWSAMGSEEYWSNQ